MIRLFTSLKSAINLTVWFNFGMMKVGEAHSEGGCFFTSKHLNPLISSLVDANDLREDYDRRSALTPLRDLFFTDFFLFFGLILD